MVDTRQLKAQMVLRGLSQEGLADMLGISLRTLNAKLNGRADFSVREATSLAGILSLEDPGSIFFAKEVN